MKVESDLSSHVISRSNRGGSAEFDLQKYMHGRVSI